MCPQRATPSLWRGSEAFIRGIILCFDRVGGVIVSSGMAAKTAAVEPPEAAPDVICAGCMVYCTAVVQGRTTSVTVVEDLACFHVIAAYQGDVNMIIH